MVATYTLLSGAGQNQIGQLSAVVDAGAPVANTQFTLTSTGAYAQASVLASNDQLTWYPFVDPTDSPWGAAQSESYPDRPSFRYFKAALMQIAAGSTATLTMMA